MTKSLITALTKPQRDIKNMQKTDEEKKSLFNRLQKHKEESERNAVPIDGHETPEISPAVQCQAPK